MTVGDSRTQMVKVAAACDVADLVAVAIAHRTGKISAFSAVLFAGASLGCLALGARSLTEA